MNATIPVTNDATAKPLVVPAGVFEAVDFASAINPSLPL
jgi:hypothetical protein